ncbi:hypothetical protein GCM10010977_32200 [Citricoccus zhacaiensis]|uniref:Secreted protein n=2 Tax=Citricoccus zhacaiensis TaxID=489142 RepID=A0ABQ2MGB1_9MICC|nr:hypothetical protein GCM10010977_32200 [Citricoccus zhacaiensis]
MQLLVASVGVAGTLAGALLSQLLAGRAEKQRRVAENQSRWLADSLRVNTRLLAGSLSLERDMWSAAAQLDRDNRPVRMPAHTTILLTPEQGIPGVFDRVTRAILVEAVEEAFERLDVLEEVAAEIALVGTVEEVSSAHALHEALWDVVGGLESYQAFDVVADAVERARAARDNFTRASRMALRSSGESIQVDSRPRRLI